MTQKLTAGAGRKTLAFDEGIVGNGGPERFAPAETFLHGLTGGGHRHGVEPPALFRSQRFPVAQGIRDVVGRGFFHSPAEDAEFLAEGRFEATATLLAQATTPQPVQAPPPPPTPQQRVAMLKQWMQASQMQLRAYEWMETTVMLKSGEEKSRKVNQIYYSVDGKQLKIPVNTGEEKKSGDH